VLAGPGAWRWATAASRLHPLPLQVLPADSEPGLRRAYRLAEGSAVLVRPEGVIAWRHDGPCSDPAAALAAAVTTALGRADAEASVAV
jgi:putative polyketide hydroxylase